MHWPVDGETIAGRALDLGEDSVPHIVGGDEQGATRTAATPMMTMAARLHNARRNFPSKGWSPTVNPTLGSPKKR